MEEQIAKLKIKIPFEESGFTEETDYNSFINGLLEDSKNIALSNLYPFIDWSEKELPKKFYNWQIRACVEIYNYLGKEGIKTYSENGLSSTRLTDGLSYDLQNEIMPMAGYII